MSYDYKQNISNMNYLVRKTEREIIPQQYRLRQFMDSISDRPIEPGPFDVLGALRRGQELINPKPPVRLVDPIQITDPLAPWKRNR